MTGGLPKWPRQYAAEIIALPTREARRKALADVPEHLREWVKHYVTDYFEKRKHRREQHGSYAHHQRN